MLLDCFCRDLLTEAFTGAQDTLVVEVRSFFGAAPLIRRQKIAGELRRRTLKTITAIGSASDLRRSFAAVIACTISPNVSLSVTMCRVVPG